MGETIKESISLNKSNLGQIGRLPGTEPYKKQEETLKNGYPPEAREQGRIKQRSGNDHKTETETTNNVSKDRASTGFQVFLYTVAGIFDLIPIILNLLAVGLAVNRIITIIGYIVFFIIMQIKGLKPSTHSDLYLSLAAMSGLEFIPVVDMLPFWCKVAYSIIKTIEEEDGTTHGISGVMGAINLGSKIKGGRKP